MDAYRMMIETTGDPRVIAREAIAMPSAGPGDVVVAQTVVGVNFIDTYHRSGLYALPLPSGLGSEAVGRIVAIGEGVQGWEIGARVGYASGPPGAYATHRAVPAALLVAIPDEVSDEAAASVLLKGMTAEALIERCAKVRAADWVLVHAAAGGMGTILVQWLKAIGARVIAHAGSADKAARTSASGADIALSCPFDMLAAAVRDATGGVGAAIVFDGVGAASWLATLASTARCGLIVSYGNASGPVPPVAPLDLARAGSLFLTRPSMFDYTITRDQLQASAARLFAMIASQAVQPSIGQRFRLADAADAHRALEARATHGSTVLIV